MGTHSDSTCVAQWLLVTGAGVFMAAGATAALLEGGGSLLPAGLIICAISGWLCFSSRILVISRVKAAGSSTNALASASGLSRTMAISISPPSSGWGPVGRLASAQGSQLPYFRIGCVAILPGLSVLRCQFAVGHFGLLASPMRGWRDCQAAWRMAGLR